jgi:hypothetical protein
MTTPTPSTALVTTTRTPTAIAYQPQRAEDVLQFIESFRLAPQTAEEQRAGWIYVMCDAAPAQRVKIGYSKERPDQRLAAGTTMNPDLEQLAQFHCTDATAAEAEIHRRLHDQRYRPRKLFSSGTMDTSGNAREWFAVSSLHALQVCAAVICEINDGASTALAVATSTPTPRDAPYQQRR